MIKICLFPENNKKFPTLRFHKILLTFLFTVLFTLLGFSQKIEIKGQILEDKTKAPIIGATIQISNEQIGVISNANGEFSLNIKSLPVSLIITMIGYIKQEIDIYENEPVVIYLSEDVTHLNDVVVIGYGTQKRKELTGAIASVSATHLEYNVAPSVDALLGGAVAGVSVTQSWANRALRQAYAYAAEIQLMQVMTLSMLSMVFYFLATTLQHRPGSKVLMVGRTR